MGACCGRPSGAASGQPQAGRMVQAAAGLLLSAADWALLQSTGITSAAARRIILLIFIVWLVLCFRVSGFRRFMTLRNSPEIRLKPRELRSH